MKIRSCVTYGTVFLIGFTVAWGIRTPRGTAADAHGRPVSEPTKLRADRTQRPTAATGTRNSRFDGLLKQLADAEHQKDKEAELLAGIDTADLLPMIERIARGAGFTGLGYREMDRLGRLLTAWSERDPEAALAWADGIENPKDRKDLLDKVIVAVSDKDSEKGLELVRRYCLTENGRWDIPYEIQGKLASLDAETMLRTLGTFVSSNGTSGRGGTFSEGYDFRRALDGLADLHATLTSGNQSLAVVPANLLKEWARRDPEGARAWCMLGRTVPCNDLSEFMDGYCSTATPEQAAQALVDFTTRSPQAQVPYQNAWGILGEQQSAETIERFIALMPGDREDKLGSLLKASTHSMGGPYDRSKALLVKQMTAEERVSVFESCFGSDGCDDHSREIFQPMLRQLGHGDEEIRRMLPEAASHPE